MAKWKKIITSGSNASLSTITTTGDVSSSGTLFANLPESTFTEGNTNDVKVVVQDVNTGQFFTTGSYGGESSGNTPTFETATTAGTTPPVDLTNLHIKDFETGDVTVSIVDGVLTLQFGDVPEPFFTSNLTDSNTFDHTRFNKVADGYELFWNFNLNNSTFVSLKLFEGGVNPAEGNGTEVLITLNENSNSFQFIPGEGIEDSSGNSYTILARKFQLELIVTLLDGSSFTITSNVLNQSITEPTPGSPSFSNFNFSGLTPSDARESTRIEEGAEGIITTTVEEGSNNSWTNQGVNTQATTATPNATSVSSKDLVVGDTGDGTTGNHYQHWIVDDTKTTDPREFHSSAFSKSYTRMKSFRFGVSKKEEFTLDDIHNLATWPQALDSGDPSSGTIAFGVGNYLGNTNASRRASAKSEIQNYRGPGVASTDPSGIKFTPSFQYIYIIYDSLLGDLDQINGALGPEIGSFESPITTNGYKIYRTISTQNAGGTAIKFSLVF